MFNKKKNPDFPESIWWLMWFMFRKRVLKQKAYEVWNND